MVPNVAEFLDELFPALTCTAIAAKIVSWSSENAARAARHTLRACSIAGTTHAEKGYEHAVTS